MKFIKNLSKRGKIIMGSVAGAVAVAVIITAAILTSGGDTPPLTAENPIENERGNEVVVNVPTDTTSDTESGEEEETEESELIVVVIGDPDPTVSPGNGANDDAAEQPAQPVNPQQPPATEPVNENDGETVGDGADDAPEPSNCPEYDIRRDPVHFCQTCDRRTGDGRNNTCAQFVNPANCPLCNRRVPSWTCHTC